MSKLEEVTRDSSISNKDRKLELIQTIKQQIANTQKNAIHEKKDVSLDSKMGGLIKKTSTMSLDNLTQDGYHFQQGVAQKTKVSTLLDGLEAHPIPGDGNCLFNSIIHSITLQNIVDDPNLQTQDQLRGFVGSELAKEAYQGSISSLLINAVTAGETEGFGTDLKAKLEEAIVHSEDADFSIEVFILENNLIDSYITDMMTKSVWGGDIELGIISDLLGLQIVVMTPGGDTTAAPIIVGEDANPTIVLKHTGEHYNMYLPIEAKTTDMVERRSDKTIPRRSSRARGKDVDYTGKAASKVLSDAIRESEKKSSSISRVDSRIKAIILEKSMASNNKDRIMDCMESCIRYYQDHKIGIAAGTEGFGEWQELVSLLKENGNKSSFIHNESMESSTSSTNRKGGGVP